MLLKEYTVPTYIYECYHYNAPAFHCSLQLARQTLSLSALSERNQHNVTQVLQNCGCIRVKVEWRAPSSGSSLPNTNVSFLFGLLNIYNSFCILIFAEIPYFLLEVCQFVLLFYFYCFFCLQVLLHTLWDSMYSGGCLTNYSYSEITTVKIKNL